MKKIDKIKYIIDTLELLFPEVPIPLDHKDPYTLLIAVLLSAQSTDVGVNKITPILFSRADNPADMIKLSVDEIRNIIRPVGLSPMKSKGIHGLSKILIEKHNGKVPQNFEDLEALPAVGHVKITEKDAKRIFPIELWNKLHLQIIWYGRQYSPARGWTLKTDLITRKIGRKSLLKKINI